jgi:DNA-binding transcriptional ArsR family regulator
VARAHSTQESLKLKRRAFSDPLRVRVLEVLATGERTVKQLGRDVGIDPNRLYYHLRILEGAALIHVTGTEAVGRMVEKRYGTTGESFGNELPGDAPEERITFFHALLDATKADLTDVVLEQDRQQREGHKPLTARLLKGILAATPEDLITFAERFETLLEEFMSAAQRAPDAADLRAFPYTFAIYERPSGQT